MSSTQPNHASAPVTSNGQIERNAELPTWRVTPQYDLYESDAEYLLVIDMPKATVESLSVQVVGKALHVAAQRPPAPQGTDVAAITFERRIALPAEVDADSASAQLDSGVLEIRISKAPSARRVKIPVVPVNSN